nr:hypothetical protein OG781_43330 [Streptomyces sp. NBC_00830]
MSQRREVSPALWQCDVDSDLDAAAGDHSQLRIFLTGNSTLKHGRITETAVEPTQPTTSLVRPDGKVPGPSAVVCRGPRIYLRGRGGTGWSVIDLGA